MTLVMEDLFGKIPILNILVNFYRVKGMALEHLNGWMVENILEGGRMAK